MAITTYVVKRTGHAEFAHMVQLHKWCERNFGKPDCFSTWDVNFWDHTDDWVAFKFFDATMAFWFKQRFPEVMTEEEATQKVQLI